MIKPSTPSPAATPASRPAAPQDDEARTVAREGGDAAFNDVMDAQAPRDEARAACEPARRSDEAETREPKAAEPSPQPPTDPMLGLCLPQPVELAASAACTLASAACPPLPPGAEDIPVGAAPVAASASRPVADDLRATLDGLRQPRPPQGLDVTAVVAEPVRDDPAPMAKEDQAATPPTGAASAMAAGEPRPGSRAAGPEAVQAPARPPELRAPLGSGAWTDELGARVTWMVDRGDQFASLRLSPENLGPLEVRIAVREGETSVWFGAAQAETRAALEQSLPRLREMLGASGLSLADAGVFSHTPRDPQRGFTTAALARASQESGVDAAGAIVMQVSRRGLVDLYA